MKKKKKKKKKTLLIYFFLFCLNQQIMLFPLHFAVAKITALFFSLSKLVYCDIWSPVTVRNGQPQIHLWPISHLTRRARRHILRPRRPKYSGEGKIWAGRGEESEEAGDERWGGWREEEWSSAEKMWVRRSRRNKTPFWMTVNTSKLMVVWERGHNMYI